MMNRIVFGVILLFIGRNVIAQQELETGSLKPMPEEWIDKDTHHKVIRLARSEGSNASFYFHNNPFIPQKKSEGDLMIYYNSNKGNRQIYALNLKTLQSTQITNSPSHMMVGEIVGPKNRNVWYQVHDSVYVTNVDSKQTKLVFVFPADYKGTITTLNADETMLAGARATDEQKEILRKYPEKSQYFNRIFEAHLLNELFSINIKTGEIKTIHKENTWLGHVQFSPTNPHLLMFCHEGPWHLVDRIWTINLQTNEVKLMHKRTVNMEIAGHEFFNPNGKQILFDLQIPRSQNFYLGMTDLATGDEKKYQMQRNEWSIHFNVSPDQHLYAGDGGDSGQVAKAKDGMWIYLFRPNGDHFDAERLVMMKHHNYHLEPNVHFSPDGKWIIFRANFEGEEQIYAVEIAKSK
jgi:oligogalacturonide lyase